MLYSNLIYILKLYNETDKNSKLCRSVSDNITIFPSLVGKKQILVQLKIYLQL